MNEPTPEPSESDVITAASAIVEAFAIHEHLSTVPDDAEDSAAFGSSAAESTPDTEGVAQ